MGNFRFLTAGESHGPGLTVILEGIPAGLELAPNDINGMLSRRQRGYGAGGRMMIESDAADIRSGVRHGVTLGSPIAVWLENKDFANWREAMSITAPEGEIDKKSFSNIVPGHADFAGALKYMQHDLRNVLERASARETAARVVAGAIAATFLSRFGMRIRSRVKSIGDVLDDTRQINDVDWGKIEDSLLRTDSAEYEGTFKAAIDEAKRSRTTIGGVIQVVAWGAPVGLGSHIQWDKKLDANLARAMVSINAVKGVEIGPGFANTTKPGNEVQDVLVHNRTDRRQFEKISNHAGGIEGGMSNGNPIELNVAIKPIATMTSPLPSVDINTGASVEAPYHRSDICQVARACPIGEAMMAIVLADAMLDKFGGDSMKETQRNYAGYIQSHTEFGKPDA